MSYADFIAALEHEGIDISKEHTHWDENGVLVIDYESLDDVPHTINLVNSQDHVETSSAIIDKSGANSKGNVIDSGEVTAQHTEKSKQIASQNKETPKKSSSIQTTSNKKSSGSSSKTSSAKTASTTSSTAKAPSNE